MTAIVTNRLPILAGEIKTALAATRAAATVTLTSAILAGERLIEAKALVAHGQWLPWLEEHCELSVRSAQVYMQVAKTNTQSAAHLTIDAALTALTAPARTDDPWQDTGRWAEPVSRVGYAKCARGTVWFCVVPSIRYPGHYWASHIYAPDDANEYMDLYIEDWKKPPAARAVDSGLRYWLGRAPCACAYDSVEWREHPREDVAAGFNLIPRGVVPLNEDFRYGDSDDIAWEKKFRAEKKAARSSDVAP